MTKTGIVYTPKKTENYEALVKSLASVAMMDAGLAMREGPVSAAISITRMAPKYLLNNKKTRASLDGGYTLPCPTRPDCDNLAKAILDACNKIIYRDDSQVWSLRVWKQFGLKEETEVTIGW